MFETQRNGLLGPKIQMEGYSVRFINHNFYFNDVASWLKLQVNLIFDLILLLLYSSKIFKVCPFL
jgi:hypothetical protein